MHVAGWAAVDQQQMIDAVLGLLLLWLRLPAETAIASRGPGRNTGVVRCCANWPVAARRAFPQHYREFRNRWRRRTIEMNVLHIIDGEVAVGEMLRSRGMKRWSDLTGGGGRGELTTLCWSIASRLCDIKKHNVKVSHLCFLST